MDPTIDFLAAAFRIATPLLWAALGELIAERAGVINLSVEGAMLAGCLGAALGASASGDPWVGLVAGGTAGLLVALAFAAIAIWGRVDQIIVGTALTLGSIGVTGLWYRRAFGSEGVGLTLPTIALAPTFGAVALVGIVWWGLFRTTWGLSLRATGEAAEAARASGVRVRLVQTMAVVVGGALAGIGGATLVLAQVGTFAERMTAGRGFIAIAIVVLGRWHPVGVLVASVGFGAATALQFAFQAMGLAVPYQFFLMLPYLIALIALTGVTGRARAPGQLGRTVE
jgi:ABC-type uncharacterized transport system permease subunit